MALLTCTSWGWDGTCTSRGFSPWHCCKDNWRSPSRYTPLDFTVCKVGMSLEAVLVAVSDEQPGNHHGRWNHRGGSQQPAKAATQAPCSTRAPQNADSGCAWCWSLMFCSPQIEQELSLSGTFGVEDTKIQSLCPSQGPPACSCT